jgi:hypothetical protein
MSLKARYIAKLTELIQGGCLQGHRGPTDKSAIKGAGRGFTRNGQLYRIFGGISLSRREVKDIVST